MKDKCFFIGNNNSSAAISNKLGIDWLCVPSLSRFPLFASTIDSKLGGSVSIDIGEEFMPIYQRYVSDYDSLETCCKTSRLKVIAKDSILDNDRVLIRDIEFVNISDYTVNFKPEIQVNPTSVKGHTVVVKNFNEFIVVSDEKLCLIIGFSKGIKDIILNPGESYNNRMIIAYGESYVEANCNFYSVVDLDIMPSLRTDKPKIMPRCFALENLLQQI